MTKVYQAFNPDVSSRVVQTTDLLVGIECEVEGVREYNYPAIDDSWTVTDDGSLRNSGREFISCPIAIDSAVPAFQNLHANIVCKTGQKFSERTSIHVHVNCANLEVEEARSAVLYYALFEELFFAMVDPNRRHNIHCVPLTETYLPSYYRQGLNQMVQRWQKYTALNLLPLKRYGTIEFRHMEGHDNPQLFDAWLCTIKNLMTYAKERPMCAEVLSDEGIYQAYSFIFKDSHLRYTVRDLNHLLFNQKLDLKLAFV